jgi:hypothetical protein
LARLPIARTLRVRPRPTTAKADPTGAPELV